MSVSDKKPKDPAKARFFALVLIRWTGVGLVMPTLLARKWKSRDL